MSQNTQADKARLLKSLHNGNDMLIFPNIWDPAGALLLESCGYPAVATASAAVAYANGYQDGEQIPFSSVLSILRRITQVVDVPVTADIETGYSLEPLEFEANIRSLIDTGIVGINIEDSNPLTNTLLPIETQVERLQIIRKVADEVGVPLFINARVDVFFKPGNLSPDAKLEEALKRGKAYAQAGADCIFPAFVKEESVINHLVNAFGLPINIMVVQGVPEISVLKELGVARVSFGSNFLKANLLATKKLMQNILANPSHEPITGNVIAMDFLKN